MTKIKGFIIDILKRHEWLRRSARKTVWGIRRWLYKLSASGKPVNKNQILFETFMGRQYGCNPRAIYEYMISDERFDDCSFVWVFKSNDKKAEFEQLERSRVVIYKTREYFDAVARSAVVVTNSNLEDRITRKSDQCFMQTWHGTPLKRLRCDIEVEKGNAANSLTEIRNRNDIDIKRYNYFLSPSAFSTEKFISAFNLEKLGLKDIIAEIGYPRNDKLAFADDKKSRKIKEELGIALDKKIILYAPTFRDNKHDSATGYIHDSKLDFDRLRDALGEDHVIVFRTHYFIANQFDFTKYESFIYNASNLDDITDLYLIADILITDYSSVFFDYANLNRKIIYYMYDLDEYKNDIRGFYISLDELPGRIVTTEDELLEAIAQNDPEMEEKFKAFNKKYNSLEDGNSSKRAAEIILEKLQKQ